MHCIFLVISLNSAACYTELCGLFYCALPQDDPAVSPYPKFVWTPTGGWYCNPPNWRRNTGLAMIFVLVSSGVMWYVSAQLEVRVLYLESLSGVCE